MEILNSLADFQIDCDLWEYLLVAHPGQEVNRKIIEEEENFHSKYEWSSHKKMHPHIAIANFLAKEAMEETFIRWIQNICNLQRSFTVTLNNYGAFPPHGLYLRILDAQPFRKLANALKILDGFMQSNNCPPLKLVSKPHISFVAGLSEYDYETVVRDYSRKTFHESFELDRLFLFKRDAYMKCHLVNSFILPPPVALFD